MKYEVGEGEGEGDRLGEIAVTEREVGEGVRERGHAFLKLQRVNQQMSKCRRKTGDGRVIGGIDGKVGHGVGKVGE